MHPDLILFEATEADLGWDERRLRFVLGAARLQSPVYREMLSAVAVSAGSEPRAVQAGPPAVSREILAGVYRAMAADAKRAHDVPIIWVLIPRVGRPTEPARRIELIAMAHASGFSAVVDISDAYDGVDPASAGRSIRRLPPQRRGARPAVAPPRRGPEGFAALATPWVGRLFRADGHGPARSAAPMITTSTGSVPAAAALLRPLLLLAAGLIAWPPQWSGVRAVVDCLRGPEPGPTERENLAVGYYVDLIEGTASHVGANARRPAGWVDFRERRSSGISTTSSSSS